jgi:capsule polysaccharide export protein KpsC/LpsZ
MSKDHIKLDEWDIVKWLTVVSDDYCMERCLEAADEIKRLRAREALLLEALKKIVNVYGEDFYAGAYARAALGEEKK